MLFTNQFKLNLYVGEDRTYVHNFLLFPAHSMAKTNTLASFSLRIPKHACPRILPNSFGGSTSTIALLVSLALSTRFSYLCVSRLTDWIPVLVAFFRLYQTLTFSDPKSILEHHFHLFQTEACGLWETGQYENPAEETESSIKAKCSRRSNLCHKR